MEPHWISECGTVKLWCADCREVLPSLPSGSVDAVVTDPPYGIGFKYESHDDTPEGYGEWLWECISASERLCTDGAPIFVWQAMKNVRRFPEWFPREYRIFAAAKNFVQMRPTPMQYAYDPVVTWWTNGKPWASGTASRDFHVGNTANTLNRERGDAEGHPCARPLDQLEHVLEQWVRPGSTCLDCFMGSGTTGVAAVRLGRKFLGIEKEPRYFEIARRRIQDALNSQPLFKEQIAEKQEELWT